MKVLRAKVDWQHGSDNDPSLRILVDRIPPLSEMVFEKRGPLYYAESFGMAKFFAYDGPDRGYGGEHFPIVMLDGTRVVLKGPWSSNASAVNGAGFGPCVDAHITENPEAFESGLSFRSGAVTLELAKVAADLAGAHMVRVDDWYDSSHQQLTRAQSSAVAAPLSEQGRGDHSQITFVPSTQIDRIEKPPACFTCRVEMDPSLLWRNEYGRTFCRPCRSRYIHPF